MVRLLVVDATTLFMLLFLFSWGLSNDSTFRLSQPSWVMEWDSITFSRRRVELPISFNVIHVSSHTYSVDDDQVAVSPNVIPELIYGPQSPAPSPSTIEAILLITRGIRQTACNTHRPLTFCHWSQPVPFSYLCNDPSSGLLFWTYSSPSSKPYGCRSCRKLTLSALRHLSKK
ncbi:hypothetical protein AVEN_141122-1 [Araneus ventricosus]|uniref:Uncharacterized protein n=1 Tax=Araneus ventricosus TaxID=182803 RepID=A0A4Y2AV04_ARAVE|nr:hypothetical protein AVEN_141122-1 [Araneus ventricosus]